MDLGLIVTLIGIIVAALAGVLGVWMERNPESTKIFAIVFSGLIGLAMTVEMGHAVIAQIMDWGTEETMAEVLAKLDEIAANSDNPELREYVDSEIAAQSRSNPRVAKKMDRKIAARGGDPNAVHARAAASRKGGKAGKRGGAAPAPAPATPAPADGAEAPAPDAAADGTEASSVGGKGGSVPTGEAVGGEKAKAGKAGKAGKQPH